LRVVTPKLSQSFSQLNTTDVTQITFALVQYTFETQIFCLHIDPDFMVDKNIFNENQLHIIFHPFYNKHCVGKT